MRKTDVNFNAFVYLPQHFFPISVLRIPPPLYFGRRGGRKHTRDLTHEIEERLELWDRGDVPTLWQHACKVLSFQQVRRAYAAPLRFMLIGSVR